MCDQGYDLTFHAKYCEIHKTISIILVGRMIMTPANLYIINEIQGYICYIG